MVSTRREKRFVNITSLSYHFHFPCHFEGATFFRTDNERFVLKTLSRFELDSLKNCSQKVCFCIEYKNKNQSNPQYIDYVSMAVLERKLTALCKVGYYSFLSNNVNLFLLIDFWRIRN
jgi:hypothetical protein